MTECVKIEITSEDIAHGVRDDCEKCPVALAALRAIPTCHGVQVDANGIDFQFYDEPYSDYYELPDQVRDFITRFDMGFRVEPFSFVLEVNTGT